MLIVDQPANSFPARRACPRSPASSGRAGRHQSRGGRAIGPPAGGRGSAGAMLAGVPATRCCAGLLLWAACWIGRRVLLLLAASARRCVKDAVNRLLFGVEQRVSFQPEATRDRRASKPQLVPMFQSTSLIGISILQHRPSVWNVRSTVPPSSCGMRSRIRVKP